MTREEAFKKAINIVAYFEAHFAKSKEAREDAVNIIEVLEQEPCEDVIRREGALQALCKAVHKNDDTIPCPNQRVSCLWSKTKVQDYAEEIWKVPPVTPQPKTGHWISHYDEDAKEGWYECDRCHTERAFNTKFCPDCGAKMIEPQERSGKEMTRRTKGEKQAYLDGFEMCAECIESYLTSAGRQQLERLLVAVKNAANIEDFTERQEGAYNKCPICVNRNKNCQFGSSDCHFEEQTDVAESENKG